MNIILVGIQGSGKGTQAKFLSKKFKLCHISTGNLLRNITGDRKKEIDSLINNGKLVPDKTILEILKERMIQDDCENGIILDGFPRNIEQAKLLEKELNIQKVIEIQISDQESEKRLMGRISCPKCGIDYNIYTAPKPQKEGFCDKCGSQLTRRKDDNEESIKKRIKTYHEETKPILNYYKNKLITVNGEQSIEDVSKEILKKISNSPL